MNKTEAIALELIKEREGYKEDQIQFNSNKSPDFICSDGKRYEIKILYWKKIIFHSTQVRQLKDGDIILVFDKGQCVTEFKWKERDKSPYKIKIQYTDDIKMVNDVCDETWSNFTTWCRKNKYITGRVLTKILKDFLKKKNIR